MYKVAAPPPAETTTTTTTAVTTAVTNGVVHSFATEQQPLYPLAVVLTIDDRITSLTACLEALQPFNVTLSRIESRPSKVVVSGQDILMELRLPDQNAKTQICSALAAVAQQVRLVDDEDTATLEERVINSVPAFPRTVYDLDGMSDRVILLCEELEPDHPGVSDQAYRKRRVEISQIAKDYRHGQPLPNIEYTETETETWRAVYRRLTNLYPTYACREFQENFALLVQHCGYSEDRIPQQESISKFLKEQTGFTMRPTAGLLTSRDFLNSLAFKVFNATQYIRHHSSPFYSPEPDLCHELFGHVALFADQDYAEFCQQIGLASLGASDEDIDRLASLFMYTVEFGMCGDRQDPRVYGAGLLAAAGELAECKNDPQKLVTFDPADAAGRQFAITGSQAVYYVAESIQDVKHKVREFIATIQRPFDVRYVPETESIEVFNVRLDELPEPTPPAPAA